MRIEIENWWKQAQRDLVSAKNSLNSKDYYICAFLCQQAVEKGLKARLMLSTKERIFITHSLVELGKRAKVSENLIEDLRRLAPEYTISRYPDVTETLPYENYSLEIAQDRLKRAERIFQWLNTLMKN
ncbi:HEPN domain-containing protein [Candidatus Woesearchaeota archaeon]|nr:HEPN domain-containing protein [Candidatus Woesearchaeota archaeon]